MEKGVFHLIEIEIMENFSENSLEQNQKNFLTNQLPERYGLGKSTCYDRMKALYIRRFMEGGRAYISPEHLQLMDDLDAYLKAGKGEIREFVQQCVDEKRIVVSEEPQSEEEPETEAIAEPEEPETGAIVVMENQAIASPEQPTTPCTAEQTQFPVEEESLDTGEASQILTIANLQVAKGEQVQAADIQEVSERAQQRAFAKAAAEETLTLVYEATEEFTIPGLKEQLEQHRAACNQARKRRGAAHNVNDFLAQALKFQRGSSGSTGSNTSSRNQSPTSNDAPVIA